MKGITYAWRLCKARHQQNAFTGEGTQFASGRWHSRCVPVVYCSDSLALAALEVLANLGSAAASIEFVFFKIPIPSDAIDRVEQHFALPNNWNAIPADTSTQVIGSQWVKNATSVALSVPSVLVPTERNILLNPTHPDFTSIIAPKISPASVYSFDSRLHHK